MESISEKKLHFSPLARQQKAIQKLLSEGRYRNITHFMRCAIDYYLDRLGRPTLTEQARQMADEFNKNKDIEDCDASQLQDSSRLSPEEW